MPVLLVLGENSPDPAKPYAGTVAEGLPNARIMMLDGHDHVADALDPEFFAARVVPFLLSDD